MKYFDLVRPLVLQNLFDVDAHSASIDFKKWIAAGNYLVRDIPTPLQVHIEANNEFRFHEMIAHDSCRMASAAFETMYAIHSTPSLSKSYSWIAIKAYYAAFLSAHSIMRCFGYTCSQLERGHVRQINDFGQIVGLSESIRAEAGYFSGVYDKTSRILLLKRMKNTHEDTWGTFVSCLEKMSMDLLGVAGLTNHKQQLSVEVTDLISILNKNGKLGKGNFLSQFRNAVNYRQEHHCWHPYGKSSIKSDKIVSYLNSWTKTDPTSTPSWKESQEAYNFFYACRTIVHINYFLIKMCAEYSASNTNIYNRWPLKLVSIASR